MFKSKGLRLALVRYTVFTATRIVGILFIVLGIIGLFLPFLQGILFLVLGLYLYSFSSPRLRGWIEKRIAPYPKLALVCVRIDAGIRNKFRV